MTDLQKGQTAWTGIEREFGAYLKRVIYLEEARRRFRLRPQRVQMVYVGDDTPRLSAWSLSGTTTNRVEFGTNISEDGRWWVRVTGSPSPFTVSVYKAAGGGAGDLVAEGSIADAATGTLAEQNSSGLTFTVTLGTGADDTSDTLQLHAFPDFPALAYLFDGSEDEHEFLRRDWLDSCDVIAGGLEALKDSAVGSLRVFLASRWAAFNRASEPEDGDAIINKDTINVDGVVSTRFTGLLELGRDNMEDETSPGAQEVVENVVTANAPAADGGNDGVGSLSTPTMEEWARAGLITLVCVDATIGREEFALSIRYDDDGLQRPAENRLRIKKTYASPVLGIQDMVLTRTFAITGAANDFGVVADWAIDGESSGNTDGGVIYLDVEEHSTPGTFRINGYRSSARTSATKVFTSAYVAAGVETPIIAVGSGMSGTVSVGAAPTDANTGSIDLQTFETQRSADGKPDKWTIDIDVTSQGRIQRVIAREFDYALHSDSAATGFLESYATAGVFMPFSVADA